MKQIEGNSTPIWEASLEELVLEKLTLNPVYQCWFQVFAMVDSATVNSHVHVSL